MKKLKKEKKLTVPSARRGWIRGPVLRVVDRLDEEPDSGQLRDQLCQVLGKGQYG